MVVTLTTGIYKGYRRKAMQFKQKYELRSSSFYLFRRALARHG